MIFYGWIIVAISFITVGIGLSMRASFSVFYVAILEEFGWSRAVTAGAMSMALLTAGLSGFLIGILIDKFGPRKVMPLGAIILALGLMACSTMKTIWEFYFYFGIIVSLGISSIWWVPHAIILSHWFIEKRSTAMGITLSGMGAGLLIFLPLTQYMISILGWRWTYVILATIVVFFIVPLTAIFQRHKPEDMGLLAYGFSESKFAAKREVLVVDEKWASQEWTILKAMRTYRFWLCFLTSILAGFTFSVIDSHQFAHITGVGYSKIVAASILGLTGIIVSGGSILGGFISDRVGREAAYTLSSIVSVLGILLLILMEELSYQFMPYAYAIFYGLGSGINIPISPALHADIFQGNNFGTIFGFLNIGFGLGGAVGPWLGGYLFDLMGSYKLAFVLVIIGLAISCGCVWITAPRKVRLVGFKASRKAGEFDKGKEV